MVLLSTYFGTLFVTYKISNKIKQSKIVLLWKLDRLSERDGKSSLLWKMRLSHTAHSPQHVMLLAALSL
jgi:hypothetical protein